MSAASRAGWVWIAAMGNEAAHALCRNVIGQAIDAGDCFAALPAVCGAEVVPTNLAAPPRPACLRCLTVLRARATLRPLAERLDGPKGRTSSLVRILRRCAAMTPAGTDSADASAPAGFHHEPRRRSA